MSLVAVDGFLPRRTRQDPVPADVGVPEELVAAVATLGVPLTGSVVAVVSRSFGAEHDAAVAQVVDRLRHVGALTRTLDVVDLFPGATGRLVRWSYTRLLKWWPAGWTLSLALLKPGRVTQRVVSASVVVGGGEPAGAGVEGDPPQALTATSTAEHTARAARRRGLIEMLMEAD